MEDLRLFPYCESNHYTTSQHFQKWLFYFIAVLKTYLTTEEVI